MDASAATAERRAEFRKFDQVRVYRGIAGNRLLVGVPPDLAAPWSEILTSMDDFRPVPRRNGTTLCYWVIRKYPPFTELGVLHTDALVDAIRSAVEQNTVLHHDRDGVPFFHRSRESS